MNTEPEALRLADMLEDEFRGAGPDMIGFVAARLLREQQTEIERLRADAERYRELLQRVVDAVSEPTFDDGRLDYVEVQMDRDAVAALAGARAALEDQR